MPRRGSSKPPAEPVVKPYGCDFDKAASGDGSGEAKDSTPMALLSVLLGIVGIAVMALSAVRNLPDIVNVLAVTFLVVSVYGFFVLLFRPLLSCLKSDEWKYRGSRLFLYRQLTAKMRSMLPPYGRGVYTGNGCIISCWLGGLFYG